jgi:Zn-dependent protease with chaperone function
VKFLLKSVLILLALYGILFAIGNAYLAHYHVSLMAAVCFPVGLIALQYLVSPWLIEFFLEIIWDDAGADLPARNREFIERLCAERGLKVPRIGVIYSGTPNAFSFGRVRRDARVVVTKGLMDVLSPDELNAVLAHELGHIEHYDFVVMTTAAIVPLALYQIYAFTNNISNTRALAWGSYFCYWITQYVVLLLNRTREYFADGYAAEVTRTPEALSSALVKIAYGLVRAEGEYRKSLEAGSTVNQGWEKRQHRIGGALALLGICNVRSGAALALSAASPEQAAAVMRWDLSNAWASIYEMSSTHPLTAFRVRALNRYAEAMQQSVQYPLPQASKTNWGWFRIEILIWVAPWVCLGFGLAAFLGNEHLKQALGALHLVHPAHLPPVALIAVGVTLFVRILYRYHGEFRDAQVEHLLEDTEVSEMRPRAVRLHGQIIGRGVPGAFWSPDLVLRDATGMIFLKYRQSIPFARLLFALTSADEYIGRNVEVEGWFRRGLIPYVEMSRFSDGESTKRAYSRYVQYLVVALAIVAGCVWIW